MRISDWSSDVCSSDLAQVGLSRFVVTGGNAPPVLELAEQALDEVAPAVLRTVVRDWRATVALGGDHRLDIGLGACVADGIGVVALVSEQRVDPRSQHPQQRPEALHVVRLAGDLASGGMGKGLQVG